MQDTKHFQEMLHERNISSKWIDDAIASPDDVKDHEDGTRHYVKQISQNGNRWLRIIVNPGKEPPVKITAFFYRRLRRRSNENKS